MINNYYEKVGKNIQKLIDATEKFNQLMEFLYEERDIKNIQLPVGTFQYDDWTANIYCCLKNDNNTKDIYFIEKRVDRGDNWQLKYKRLTDMCFGWDFSEAIIHINFDMLNNFERMLSVEEQNIYSEYYAEVHSYFW